MKAKTVALQVCQDKNKLSPPHIKDVVTLGGSYKAKSKLVVSREFFGPIDS